MDWSSPPPDRTAVHWDNASAAVVDEWSSPPVVDWSSLPVVDDWSSPPFPPPEPGGHSPPSREATPQPGGHSPPSRDATPLLRRVARAILQHQPVVADADSHDREFVLSMWQAVQETPGTTVRVLNMLPAFAHGLVNGFKVAEGTGFVVENRPFPMYSTVIPGSWLFIRASGRRGMTPEQCLLLAELRATWLDMPEHLAEGAYVGAARFKESRPGLDPTLADCTQCLRGAGDHCWLFDKWHPFKRVYHTNEANRTPCYNVPKQHTLLLPPPHTANTARNARRAKSYTKHGGNPEQHVLAVRPDRGQRGRATSDQILRNAAVQGVDKKLGARSLPQITDEFDTRVLPEGRLGLDCVQKSAICVHRQVFDIVNVLLERQALEFYLRDPNCRLIITSDNTPDPRGFELNGQVYTIVSCSRLEKLALDGCPVPVETLLTWHPQVTRIASGKRGYDSMLATVKNLRLYGNPLEDLLADTAESPFAVSPIKDSAGHLLAQPLSSAEVALTTLLARVEALVGDAGGEIHKGGGLMEYLMGCKDALHFWHCLLHICNLHCKASVLGRQAGARLRTLSCFLRDSNLWTGILHHLKVVLGLSPLPPRQAVKNDYAKAVDARISLRDSGFVPSAATNVDVDHLGEFMAMKPTQFSARFPKGTDIRWQYELLVNRRLLAIVHALPFAIKLAKRFNNLVK